jgi:hypothetical protein
MAQPANEAHYEGDYLGGVSHERVPRRPGGRGRLRGAEPLELVPGGEDASSGLIREAHGVTDLVALARELERNREALEAAQWGVLSGVAESLARTASEIAAAVERLQGLSGGTVLDVEEAAVFCRYVDRKTGRPKTEAFRKAAAEAGLRRHQISRTQIVYLRNELVEDIRRLPDYA